MKFLHMADTHLGKREYDIEERYDDFFAAFRSAIDSGIENEVDAILIAGDLFDRADVKPAAFIETVKIINRAKANNIPVVVIEGNHDVEFHSDSPESWLEVLAMSGYIRLLRGGYDQGKYHLIQWDEDSQCGSYTDIGNLRIIGIGHSELKPPYLARLSQLQEAIETLPQTQDKFMVLMLHTLFAETSNNGNDLSENDALTIENTKPLTKSTHYIALGHSHRKQVVRDWAYNPGSIEVCRTNEYHEKHGWFIIQVEPSRTKKVSYHEYRSRPFLMITMNLDGIDTYEAFRSALLEKVITDYAFWKKYNSQDAGIPMIELTLVGKPIFSLSALNIPEVKELVSKATNPIGVIIRTRQLSTPLDRISDANTATLDSIEIEELFKVFTKDKKYGQYASSLSEFMSNLKPMVGNISTEALMAHFLKSLDTILEA